MVNDIGFMDVIKHMGGYDVIREIFNDDEIESLIKSQLHDYLNNNYTPDDGWKDSEYYSDYLRRYGTYHFKVNDLIEYTYTMSRLSGNTTLHILSDLYIEMRDLFGEEEYWIDIFKEWFEDKTNMAVDNVI